MHTSAGRELMRLSVEAVLAVDAAEVSLLHWLFYIRAGGGLDSLIRTDGGYQQDRFVGGSQEISIRLADELGERVRLRSPVRRVEQRRGGVRVNADAGTVDASLAVVAIAPALTAAIQFDPPLPGARLQLAQRMPAGTVAKFTAIYDEPFWRSDGLSGHAISFEGPVKVIFDNSPPDGRPGALLAFALANDARRLAARPPGHRAEAVLGRLGELFGPRAANPTQFLQQDWASEPWTRGCYAGYFGPGGWRDFGATLRQPAGRLHWAGTETATEAQGSMDGAVRAGERAADEVLARLPAADARRRSADLHPTRNEKGVQPCPH
jgi:monoamine oxidase